MVSKPQRLPASEKRLITPNGKQTRIMEQKTDYKAEAIRKAYGKFWSFFKDNLDDNGWIKDRDFWGQWPESNIEWETTDHDNDYYDTRRPKSLSGIETNNGWTRIESEDDLPKEEGQYFVYSKVDRHPFYRIDIFTGRLSNAVHHVTGKPIFTHYQPIVKPSHPIY